MSYYDFELATFTLHKECLKFKEAIKVYHCNLAPSTLRIFQQLLNHVWILNANKKQNIVSDHLSSVLFKKIN